MNEQAEYLKNELRSYCTMKKWVENDISAFNDQIKACELKIKEIETQLNAGNAKGISYDYVPTTSVSEPLLKLLMKQEEYINKRNSLLSAKEKEMNSFKDRIKYVDECLNRLERPWQKYFIKSYYCYGEEIAALSVKLHRSETQLHRDKENLIKKMLKWESLP